MKKILSLLALVSLAATVVYAAPTALPGDGVINSPHDMNVAARLNGAGGDAQGRVCAFCHTPHHALDPATGLAAGVDYMPLWSHNLSTNNTFTTYGSATFDGIYTGGAGVDPLIGPSRLCMSCHDGTVAVDQHYGNAGTLTLNQASDDAFGGISVGLSGNFTNDHPIGFSFLDAITADNAHYAAGQGVQGFKFDSAAVTAGTAVYPANAHGYNMPIQATLYTPDGGTTYYMTCATCHDVHNKDNASNTTDGTTVTNAYNYLVYGDQYKSALCVACHDK